MANIGVYVATNSLSYVKSCLELNRNCVDMVDINGRPPLYYCLIYPNKEMAELLLSYHPNLYIKDKFGLTVMDYAYYYKQFYFLRLVGDNDNGKDEKKVDDVIQQHGTYFLNTLKIGREEED